MGRVRAVAALPALSLLAGAAAGLPLAGVPSTLGSLAFVVASGAAGWGLGAGSPSVLSAAVALGFFAGGAMLSSSASQAALGPSLRLVFDQIAIGDGASVVVTGVLRADAAARPSGVSLSLDVKSIDDGVPAPDAPESVTSSRAPARMPVRGGVALTVGGELARARMADWRAGRTIRAPAYLRRPSRHLNPGARDEERALARRGTTLVGTIKSGALVEVTARGHPVAEAAASTRALVREAIEHSVGRWSDRSAAIVTAILIGDRAGLDDEVERRLQEAGTYHVIAISGGNIAILAGLLLSLFRLGGMLGRVARLSVIVVLIAYAYLVGGGASVNRATMMAVVYLAGRLMDLQAHPSNVLAVAAGGLVALDPLSIADPGFLLTFGATAAIIFAVPVVMSVQRPTVVGAAAATLAASVAAEVVLFPVGAVSFSRVTFAGLVLNLAAVPLMVAAQMAGMSAVAAFMVAPSMSVAAGWVAHLGAGGLIGSAGVVRLAPFVTWRIAPPSWPVLAMYYGALIVAWVLWRTRRREGSSMSRGAQAASGWAVMLAAGAALWILVEPWTVLANRPDGRLRVWFLDVGQGDATLVRFPTGQTLLVDAGGTPTSTSYDVGDRVVAPVLRHTGVRRLDVVALTHGDADHVGGIPSVLREFRPAEVWEGIPVPRLESLKAIRVESHGIGARWTNLQAGDRMAIGEVELLLHHPGVADWERQGVRNDDSVVLELRWHDVSIVLTGDIGRAVEPLIAARIAPASVRVLKVPHHGSVTSSNPEFIQALAPHVAVASAGRSNLFGHPVPAVLDRYRDAGAEVFRTDLDGAVMVETDGQVVRVTTFSGRTGIFE